jgi:hypothetical protein
MSRRDGVVTRVASLARAITFVPAAPAFLVAREKITSGIRLQGGARIARAHSALMLAALITRRFVARMSEAISAAAAFPC